MINFQEEGGRSSPESGEGGARREVGGEGAFSTYTYKLQITKQGNLPVTNANTNIATVKTLQDITSFTILSLPFLDITTKLLPDLRQVITRHYMSSYLYFVGKAS